MKRKNNFLVLLFSMIILLSSCNLFNWDPDPETENELRIVNETKDTLIMGISIKQSDGSKSLKDVVELYPFENFRYCGMKNASVEKLIKAMSWNENDTVEIYKAVCATCGGKLIHNRGGNLTLYMGETCYVKWGAPVVTLPIDVHSFYNTNSWVSQKEGKGKNERTVYTFTITENDLNKKNNLK